MIRNYNGKVNRVLINGLRKICEIREKNLKTLMDGYNKDGKVTFYTNLNPFTGFPDELSDADTLKSEEEIREYVSLDFKERIEGFIRGKIEEDYLVQTLVDFLKENEGVYPTPEQYGQIENQAEIKRVAAATIH